MTQMTADVSYAGRGAIAAFPHSIEARHRHGLREQLLWLANQRIGELVIDVGAALMCDEALAGIVERVRTRATARGIRVSLITTPDSPAERVLARAGLTRSLTVYRTREEALRALTETPVPAQRRSAPSTAEQRAARTLPKR
ncbi:STAS domain-containing protein [Marinactinospora thermotolerans]|nr:STAS domain-containing protein [Marinactinospora thermotolerans]